MLERRQIEAGRRAAKRLMSSTVEVGTVTDGTDPETGDPTQVVTPVWTGMARIHTARVAASATSGPGGVFVTQNLVMSVPVEGTHVITTGMTAKVTANPLDTSLEGVTYTVNGTSAESQQIARRFEIERTS